MVRVQTLPWSCGTNFRWPFSPNSLWLHINIYFRCSERILPSCWNTNRKTCYYSNGNSQLCRRCFVTKGITISAKSTSCFGHVYCMSVRPSWWWRRKLIRTIRTALPMDNTHGWFSLSNRQGHLFWSRCMTYFGLKRILKWVFFIENVTMLLT